MTFVVAGVSGNTGRVVAEELLAAGKQVRVVVRDAKKGEAWKARGAEVAVADLGDAAALTRALAGGEAAYLLVPPNLAAPDGPAHQAAVVESLVRAVADSKVPHVVLLSSIAAQHPTGTGPIKGLHQAEKRLREVETTRLTALRAAYFMENLGAAIGALPQGVFPTFIPKDHAHEMIATRDIGKVAAKLLLEGRPAASQVVELGNDPTTPAQSAAVLARLTGKELAVVEPPLTEVVPTFAGFGISKSIAEQYREMFEGLISGHVAFEGGHRRERGTLTVEDVFRELLAAPKNAA